MCVYYGSCCDDFDKTCSIKTVRGDTFEEYEGNQTTSAPTAAPTLAASLAASEESAPVRATTTVQPPTPVRPTTPADRDADACSERPFDAFLQLKNGSVYAFRGEYFFQLDDTSVLPGYPKLIQDVWGMPGPVDAAFTRINCHGKSYIFKGRRYWRFDGDVLDDGFPRDISEGFDGIPDDLHAAFAVPAANHLGKEKAYFFKDDRYYVYKFLRQPSHADCVQTTRSSPSLVFSRYADLFCQQDLDGLFADLFGTTGQVPASRPPPPSPYPLHLHRSLSAGSHSSGPHRIAENWAGVAPPVDAAMAGRVFLSPRPAPPPAKSPNSRRWRKPSRKNRRRQSRQTFFDDIWSDFLDFGGTSTEETVAATAPARADSPVVKPVQYVYFFKRDKYYRVDLRSKRVAPAAPPYPRSVAKFWLGCRQEDVPDNSRGERR
ncbi:vitronectin b [Syngnathoides biaculeatus]|uniref:vitronectin b n=1 Tax=Syngnathoides biaculeatus TaxID=300417 RepID=UPI002ADE75D7|nr:vitronectin b [Syngnathoides biaculeatus]